MSWSANALRALAAGCGFVAALISVPVTAQEKGIVAPPDEGRPPAVNHRQNVAQPVLRCWQYGKLVFEKAGVKPAEIPAAAQMFRKSERDESPVYVYDMNHSLCVVSNETTPAESPTANR
jgi:hypothetical protein